LYKSLAALAFCTTRCGCTAIAQSSPSGRPSHNSGFAKFQKIIPLRSIFFRNFAKPQRVMPKFKDDKKMSYKPTDILIGLLFAGLLLGTGFMQTDLKNEPQIFMLLFGLLTLGSLFAKQPFKTSIPFYILLGTMLYINIFILTNFIIDTISPGDGWVVDTTGVRHRVMQMNWIWGVLTGLVLSPLTIVLYHKKIKRNRVLEISLTTIFIILTAIIYIKHEIL
jgi:hypothetical protein